jgi:hypothetical protein
MAIILKNEGGCVFFEKNTPVLTVEQIEKVSGGVLDELSIFVLGPVIVFINKNNELPQNYIANKFIGEGRSYNGNIYGDCLFCSYTQLPDLVKEFVSEYIDETSKNTNNLSIDLGLLISIQQFIDTVLNANVQNIIKKEIFIDLDSLKEKMRNENDSKFILSSFFYIKDNGLKNCVLYETNEYVFKIEQDKINQFIDVLITYFEQTEEYDKCSFLKNLKENNV